MEFSENNSTDDLVSALYTIVSNTVPFIYTFLLLQAQS